MGVDEVIAFYLPQFHPIPENNEFWGPGFTEWTNVAAAKPLFRGHAQPLLPADLGFYDLRVPEVRSAQAELARAAGVTAFCYWHYWFAGHEVLQRPLAEVVDSGEPDFPFCVGWANQSWTGIWHGAADRMLIEQTYPGPDDHRRHFDSLAATFADERYLEIDGRKVFYIYRPTDLPDLGPTLDLWRRLADEAGFGGLYLVAHAWHHTWSPLDHGFDASVAFHLHVPHRSRLARLRRGPMVVSFEDAQWMMTALGRDGHQPCVLSRWDNTPRSGCRGLVINDVTPDAFREHVRYAAGKAAQFPAGERLLWLKSWNEWAEGNTMEPDQQFGHGFLDALRDGLAAPALTVGPQMPDWEHLPGRRPADVARLAREQGASPAEPKPAPAAGPSAGTAAGDDSLTRSAP